jgi:hypothetical protein
MASASAVIRPSRASITSVASFCITSAPNSLSPPTPWPFTRSCPTSTVSRSSSRRSAFAELTASAPCTAPNPICWSYEASRWVSFPPAWPTPIAVNESVERRADAALAKAESLEADARTDGDAPGPGATGGRGTDGRATDGRPPDGRATESDPSVPCGCRSRRSEASSATEEQNATSDGDPGLLTRIAEAL